MRHLTGWVNHSGLEVEWPRADDVEADVFAVVTAKTLPSFTKEHNGVSVRLTQGLSGIGDHVHDLGVTQWWSLRLHKSEIEPLDTFLDIASDFQDLLSIAVGQTAQFEKVVMHHPELPALSFAGTPLGNMRHDITYYAQWSNRSAPREPVKDHDMYFTFDDLGGVDGVRRWLAVAADYRSELGRVMATRYREGMVLEDRIMNVSAALDSFDKHRRNDDHTHYVERIKHCIELAGWPFLDLITEDFAEWAKLVKEARHDLAHHRERFRAEGSVGDHILAEQLFWLFVICMLRIAQAPDAVYDAISNHAQIRRLSKRAQRRT
jgi:ApeA N-terminal domain 1